MLRGLNKVQTLSMHTGHTVHPVLGLEQCVGREQCIEHYVHCSDPHVLYIVLTLNNVLNQVQGVQYVLYATKESVFCSNLLNVHAIAFETDQEPPEYLKHKPGNAFRPFGTA